MFQVNYLLNSKKLNKDQLSEYIDRFNFIQNWALVSNDSIERLVDTISSGYAYRGAIKIGGNEKSHIKSCNLVALDFDTATFEYTKGIEHTSKACLLHTTPSYEKGKNNKHRLIFKLSRECTCAETESVLAWLLSQYTQADQSCNDAGRFYYGVGKDDPIIEILDRDAVLDVEWVLSQPVPQTKKKSKARVKKANKPAHKSAPIEEISDESEDETPKRGRKKGESLATLLKKQKMNDHQVILDILEALDGDINRLFCLYPHNLTECHVGGVDESQEWDYKWQGSNPFSATNSSGNSFLVSMREGFAPVWYDRSNGPNSGDNHGGSFFDYWHLLRFPGTDFNYSRIVMDILDYFGRETSIKGKLGEAIYELNSLTRNAYQFNELTQRIEYCKRPISLDTIRVDFEANTGVTFMNTTLLIELIYATARTNSYHPVRDYIKNNYKKNKDNIADFSIDNLCDILFHTKVPLYNVYLKNWLAAAVARVCEDRAVKYDHVFILRGDQGSGKSTFFRLLAGDDYFQENFSLAHQNNKDEILKLLQSFIVELPEIETLSTRADIGQFRHFVTKMFEMVRLPYERDTKTLFRKFVIGGSANNRVIWNDPEGNRRAHIVDFKGFVNNGWLKENRDLLWAKVYEYYLSIRHDLSLLSLTPEQEAKRAALNEFHIDQDSAGSMILEMANHAYKVKGYACYEDISKAIYPDDPFKLTRLQKSRISKILQGAGWEQKQKRVDGQRVYAFFPLDDSAIEEDFTQDDPEPIQQPEPPSQPLLQQTPEPVTIPETTPEPKPQTTPQESQPAPSQPAPLQPLVISQPLETLYKPDTNPSNGKVEFNHDSLFDSLLE